MPGPSSTCQLQKGSIHLSIKTTFPLTTADIDETTTSSYSQSESPVVGHVTPSPPEGASKSFFPSSICNDTKEKTKSESSRCVSSDSDSTRVLQSQLPGNLELDSSILHIHSSQTEEHQTTLFGSQEPDDHLNCTDINPGHPRRRPKTMHRKARNPVPSLWNFYSPKDAISFSAPGCPKSDSPK